MMGGFFMSQSTGFIGLNILAELQYGPKMVHPVVLSDENHAILVDAGTPGLAEQIISAIEEAGVPTSRLTHILLTHADADHIGSLAKLVSLLPQKVEVLCHELEKPYVQCDVPPLRLSQMEEALGRLEGEQFKKVSALVQALKANYRNLAVPVTRTVEDGEYLPCGAQVIFTPGHTPGHICLYLAEGRTLIAGDLMNITNGELYPAPDHFAYDKAAQKASLRRLLQYDIRTVVCYHGGIYQGEAAKRIKELAEG
jgi:glyoxylase-like metal-dependent hydrolase (beta-lactamase superfamily II)